MMMVNPQCQCWERDVAWVHYRKLIETRQNFLLGAKISSFVEGLGLYVHVDVDLDIWKHISHLLIPNKGL